MAFQWLESGREIDMSVHGLGRKSEHFGRRSHRGYMNTNVTGSVPNSGDPGAGQFPKSHSCSITTLSLRRPLKVAPSGLSLNQVTPDKKLVPHLGLLSHS